jgi:hypothetical protein
VIFDSAGRVATVVADLIVKAPANCCITLEAGMRLSAGRGLQQLVNASGFVCLALHTTVGSGSEARKAIDETADSASRELFALITTMVKVLLAAATAGVVTLLLHASGMLLHLCTELPLQQRLALLGRSMRLTGQLVAQALAAPVPDATSEPAVPQLLICSTTGPAFSMTADVARRKTQQIHGLVAMAITILNAGIDEVVLPGAAGGAVAAADTSGVRRQVDEQVIELSRCLLGLANNK